MANVLIEENTLLSIAEQVRSTLGTSEKMLMSDVPSKIEDVYNKGVDDTQKGDATADNVLSGKTFTNNSDVELVGTMPDNGAVNQTLSAGGSYTIPAGYHNGSGKVTAPELKVIDLGGITVEMNIVELCTNIGIDYKSLTVNNFAIYSVSGNAIGTDTAPSYALVSGTTASLSGLGINIGYDPSRGVVAVGGNSETVNMYDPASSSALSWARSRTLTCYARLIYI